MKKTIFLLVSMLALFSCYDDDQLRKQMEEFEERLAELTGTVIALVDDQVVSIQSSITDLQNVDKELKDYMTELEELANELEERVETAEGDVASVANELKTVKVALEELKTKDAALDKALADLRSYVSDNLKASKDWAESTFATLVQYESLQTELASLKLIVENLGNEVEAITAKMSKDISDAISTSESGMKLWVNAQLAEGYYDIATIDAELASLQTAYKDADTQLQLKIEEQHEALEQAKKDLTEEYKKAIRDAIEDNNGVLDTKIANAVKTAQEELEKQLDALQDFVELMEERLALLETDFVNRIQSLVFVPEYTDGMVAMYQGDGSFNVKFLVTPTRLASDLKTLWQTDRNVIQATLYYAADPQTRSTDNTLPLNVTSVEASSEGLLYLTVSEDSKNPVKEEFWEGEIGAFACIRITDGNNDKASELIALEGKKGNAFPDHVELPIPGPGTPSGVSRTANCYIISEAGSYTLKTVKGNSSNESVGIVATAEVLWESFGTDETPEVGDLLSSVSYSNGRIGFTTAETFREGNAVIAAKDASGNILWSWHIWMTDEPDEQVYYNGAGTMMDRNLGATSATPGDVGALGLLYQWGRKDPFLGSSSISSSVLAASTLEWPESVVSDASTGTVEYALANPTAFITRNSYNNDWYYTGSSETDNTRWVTLPGDKSIYDPCPVGWRVPDGGEDGVWSRAIGAFGNYTLNGSYSSADKGNNFSKEFGSADVIWYPASGILGESDGCLCNNVGYYGICWSATPYGYDGLTLSYDSSDYICPADRYTRARGLSVRCLKEGSRHSGSGGGSGSGGESGEDSGSGSGGNVDMGTAEDVSSDLETANSYIVTKSGSYKFKAYKGNSQSLAGSPSSVDPVGEIAKVEVLWESFGTSETPSVGDLIKDVAYEYPYIGFKTADTFREGNAVIAAKDANDNILWSWHIWMTDYPQSQVYYNGAGTMMDRNLGATSATPGDVGALGLLYQWGRKDPFLSTSSLNSSVVAASTLSWPTPVQSTIGIGTVEYAVANPTTFLSVDENSTTNDWMIQPDNTLWQSSKTIYDPCPVGWRVPDVEVWVNEGYDNLDSSNYGLDFSGYLGEASSIWYPCAGFYPTVAAVVSNSGKRFYYWSVTLNSDDSVSYLFGESSNVFIRKSKLRALGGSVRCLKDGSRTPSQDNPAPTPDSDPTPTPDPEPQSDDYIDEYGINHGQGVEIDGVVWAPVNCGYHATDYQWGKLYQWGRKYGQGYDEDASTPELIAGPVPVATGQSAGNAGKFYYSQSSPYNWIDVQNDNLWNAGTEENPVKTEYDPCPSGWRVPTYAELNKLRQNKSACTTNAAGQNGYWFSGMTAYSDTAPQVFFPAAGGLGGYYGYPVNRGGVGYYWSSRSYDDIKASLLRDTDIYSDYCTNGFSVRCVQE